MWREPQNKRFTSLYCFFVVIVFHFRRSHIFLFCVIWLNIRHCSAYGRILYFTIFFRCCCCFYFPEKHINLVCVCVCRFCDIYLLLVAYCCCCYRIVCYIQCDLAQTSDFIYKYIYEKDFCFLFHLFILVFNVIVPPLQWNTEEMLKKSKKKKRKKNDNSNEDNKNKVPRMSLNNTENTANKKNVYMAQREKLRSRHHQT